MKTQTYDAIVLGLGAMGSAAAYHLAKRGMRVLGIEQFGLAHDQGSAHGITRIFRKAYFEHPDYVPLLQRAHGLWRDLEAESGAALLNECGIVMAGPPGTDVMRGLDHCFASHQLPHDRLSPGEARDRIPELHFHEGWDVFFDPEAGYLLVEQCVEQHVKGAQRHGADVLLHESVLDWQADGAGVAVRTAKHTYHANKLVLTAGAWAVPALKEVGVTLQILRKVQLWYTGAGIEHFARPGFPCYAFVMPYGFIYGFPARNGEGLKLAEHSGGTPVSEPAHLDRSLHGDDEAPIRRFLGDVMPGLDPALRHFSVCMYTMSADSHFIVDTHPEFSNVVVGAGFSGHGFKFASVMGEVFADLAEHGRTDHPIDFLRLARFATLA